MVRRPRNSSGYAVGQLIDSDWEADVLPVALPRRLAWRLRSAQADGLCVDTDSQDRSCMLSRAPIELHPQIRGVTPHLGLAEHKSESTGILSDSEVLGEAICGSDAGRHDVSVAAQVQPQSSISKIRALSPELSPCLPLRSRVMYR